MTLGCFHTYWPERCLKVFEHLPTYYESEGRTPIQEKPNTLLFITGLFDTFASVPYVARIASNLSWRLGNTWSVVEIQLTSFGVGFGTGDLNRDVEEIAKGIEWLRSRTGTVSSKIVLMGHSTGSQDVLHYLYYGSAANRPPVDGAILQAPVSDREGLSMILNAPGRNEEDQHHLREVYNDCIRQAKERQNDPAGPSLPQSLTSKLGFMHAYLSPSRFLSLASPDSPDQPSLDDLFSSDLSDQQLSNTFGMVSKRGRLTNVVGVFRPILLVLISGADEHIPSSIDKEALLARWKSALEPGGTVLAPSSGVVDGVTHNGEGIAEATTNLVDRCLEYLELVEGEANSLI